MKKIYALLPSEREKECDHAHMPYSGSMPCTGPRRCTMCGMTEEQIKKMTEKKMNFAAYEEKVLGLPSVALRFIIKDAKEALQAMPDNPNAGYYQDEILICSQELTRRMNRRDNHYHDTLTKVYMILKEAGYCTNDLLDDLRDLVNDAYRPATEKDER